MKYFIANWKMNLLSNQALELTELMSSLKTNNTAEVIVCPSFTHIDAVGKSLASHIKLGAQDVNVEVSGAYTGAISISQLKDLNVSFVLVGHSERRAHFFETDEIINKKIDTVYNAGLLPVVCVGETLEERDLGKTHESVVAQIKSAFKNIHAKRAMIAYEPVWAIGTGKTPKPKDTEDVCVLIKETVKKEAGIVECSVVYGGSITPENVKSFWNQEGIDGILVGGASAKKETLQSLFSLIFN